MQNREVKIVNIARIDLLESKTTANLDELKDILIANYGNRLTDIIDDSCFEDSVCPPNPVCDQIISEMISAFKAATGEDIVLVDMWGHIHEKNMSTTLHNHRESYVSAVCYVEVPEGAGSLIFRPRINQYDNSAFATRFDPKKSVYYMFPGFIDHFVTRNLSDNLRISVSFNFDKKVG